MCTYFRLHCHNEILCLIVDLEIKKFSCEVNVDKEGPLVIGEGMMTDSRNQSPENSAVPFCESESLIENVNRCVGAFYLSHHELLMNEFKRVLNEKCTGCQMNDRNQFGHELCLLASVQQQVNICFEEVYNRVNWEQVFELCEEKLRNTDSYDLCPFLPVASAEMGIQEDRYKKLMKESLIVPYTFGNFCKLQLF